MSKEYKCVCGRIFDHPQKFNGHKRHCVISLEQLDKLEKIKQADSFSMAKTAETVHKNNIKRKEAELADWLAAEHKCENCGKIMTEKFGSGRFCSRSCANSHKRSNESRKKTSESLKKAALKAQYSNINIRAKNIEEYYRHPVICPVCNETIPYDKRRNKTCGLNCSAMWQSFNMINRMADRNFQVARAKKYKYGIYNGIPCDSSWELAFLLYHLDHNYTITRCKDSFVYIVDGRSHSYFPDFIIDGTYYEIKNYYTKAVYAKIEQFPKEKQLIVIDKQKIGKYLEYCANKYGASFIYLYDRKFPSWMDWLNKN